MGVSDLSDWKHFFGMAAAVISIICGLSAVSGGESWTVVQIKTDGDANAACTWSVFRGTDDYPAYAWYGLWHTGYINRVLTYPKDGKCKYVGMNEKADGYDDAPYFNWVTYHFANSIDETLNKDLNKKKQDSSGKYVAREDTDDNSCVKLSGDKAKCDERADAMGAVNGARAFTIMIVILFVVKFYFLFKKEADYKVCFILSVVISFFALLAIAIWAGGVQNSDKGIKEIWKIIKEKDNTPPPGVSIDDPIAGAGLADMIIVLLLELILGISYFIQMRNGESTA